MLEWKLQIRISILSLDPDHPESMQKREALGGWGWGEGACGPFLAAHANAVLLPAPAAVAVAVPEPLRSPAAHLPETIINIIRGMDF
jgi:hypothetical protein